MPSPTKLARLIHAQRRAPCTPEDPVLECPGSRIKGTLALRGTKPIAKIIPDLALVFRPVLEAHIQVSFTIREARFRESLVRRRPGPEPLGQTGPHVPPAEKVAVGDVERLIGAVRVSRDVYVQVRDESGVRDIVRAVVVCEVGRH